jgi:hypothetical protein
MRRGAVDISKRSGHPVPTASDPQTAGPAASESNGLAERLQASPAEVIALLQSLAAATPAAPGSQHRSLTVAQERELRAAGSLGVALPPLADRASTATAVEAYQISQDALTVPAVAARLGVTASRIRQRLTARSLFGVSTPGGGWRLPRFQFTDDGELPGLAQLLPALPADVHPVALDSFLTRPQPDLVITDEAVSPRDWLTSGGDPAAVARIAAGAYRQP